MAKLVILRGPSGAGKTTVAKYLKDELGFIPVDLDEIKKEGVITTDDYPIAGNDMNYLLLKGENVVTTGIYYQELLDIILNKINGFGYHIITLYCNLDTSLNRNSSRTKENDPKGSRDPEDVRKFHQLICDEKKILDKYPVINTDETNEINTLSKVLKIIR